MENIDTFIARICRLLIFEVYIIPLPPEQGGKRPQNPTYPRGRGRGCDAAAGRPIPTGWRAAAEYIIMPKKKKNNGGGGGGGVLAYTAPSGDKRRRATVQLGQLAMEQHQQTSVRPVATRAAVGPP